MPMFNGGGRNTSSNNGFNVRTYGPRLTGENSQLSLQYWDNKLSVTYFPMSGLDERGFKQFSYESRVGTTMKANDAILLYTEAMNKIVPEIQKSLRGETPNKISVGTMKGSNQQRNIWCLEYKPDADGVFSTYLVLYRELDADNKPSAVFEHKFAKREIIENYDPSTGKGESHMREMDFDIFMLALKSVFETEGPIPHSIHYANAVHAARQNRSNGFGNNGGMAATASPNGFVNNNPNSAEPVEYNGEGGDLPF